MANDTQIPTFLQHSGGPYARLRINSIYGSDSTNFKASETISDVIKWSLAAMDISEVRLPARAILLKDGVELGWSETLRASGIRDNDVLELQILQS